MELVRIVDINGLEFEVVESIPKGYEVGIGKILEG